LACKIITFVVYDVSGSVIKKVTQKLSYNKTNQFGIQYVDKYLQTFRLTVQNKKGTKLMISVLVITTLKIVLIYLLVLTSENK